MAKIFPEPGIPIKKFTEKEINRYFKKIVKSFESLNYIRLQNLKGMRGYWVSQGKERFILLDPREPLLPTLVHELCHNIFEGLSELDILTLEYSLVNVLKPRQYKKFVMLMVEKLRC